MESSLRDIIKMVKDMAMEFYRQNFSNLKGVENSLQNNLKEF